MQLTVYDIVIVGGSVAGLSSALHTSFKTLVIEKKKEIGRPVVCGEYVPLPVIHYADIPPSVIARKVKGMVTYLDGERVEKRWPGAILNRDKWERSLYERAKERGVEFWLNTRAIELKGDTILLNRNGKRFEIRAKFIIGADGPLSVIGKGINARNKRFIYGYQYRVLLKEKIEFTEVYIDREISEGYGWFFPKEKTANVGIGVKGVKEPWRVLDRFLDRLYKQGKLEKEILDRVAGPIPVGGVLDCLASKNVVLVGDAGGFTNPITGAGIYQAFWTGKLAGETANSYIADDREAPMRYTRESKKFWESQIGRDRKKRELLEKGWERDFKTLIHKTWIAFNEYYKDKTPV